jgi:surface polysaccharide O-acyltransferase-like enzyme
VTSPDRDRYLDVLRVGSIGVVIIWHWCLSVVHWDDGAIRMPNPIASVPGGWLATWVFQVVPIFFIVGGYVNATAWRSAQAGGTGARGYLTRRVRRLVLPLAVFLVAWAVFDIAAGLLISSYTGVLTYGRVVFTPLWFLAAYLWVVALTPLTAALHERSRWWTLTGLIAIIVLVDAGRFGLGIEALAWANTALVWVVVHQLGYFLSDYPALRATLSGTLAVVAVAAQALMTSLGPYPRSMVSVPGYEFSNMYPTTSAIFCVAVLQLGLIYLLRPAATNWLNHSPRAYRTVMVPGRYLMTIFVCHMTALLIVLASARGLGLDPLSEPTAAWWAQRPIWLALPALVLAGLVMIFGRFESRPPLPS